MSFPLTFWNHVLSLLDPSAHEVQGTNIIQTDALVEKASLVDSSLCSMSDSTDIWDTCSDVRLVLKHQKQVIKSDRYFQVSLLKSLGRVTNSRKMTDVLMRRYFRPLSLHKDQTRGYLISTPTETSLFGKFSCLISSGFLVQWLGDLAWIMPFLVYPDLLGAGLEAWSETVSFYSFLEQLRYACQFESLWNTVVSGADSSGRGQH